MLEAIRLCKSYPTRSGDLAVVRDISLVLGEGESAVIMGPSGSGKSTLLNMLGTLEPPSSGKVSIGGTDPFALGERDLARFRNHNIGFIFQEHHLLPQCSVLENVLLPTLADRNNRDRLQRAKELLDRVSLSNRLEHRPAELSGGERQRVAIARALINGPSLLLADEPTGNLDRKTAEGVADLMSEVHREENVILLVVTHSQQLAERFDKRWELVDGVLGTMGR
jgi:lipoprotein-releasing system ATP-binding protein